MSNGDHAVQLAVLETWRGRVDEDLHEIKEDTKAIRADLNLMSRHVGRPLLSWPQTMTLAVAMVGAVGTIAAVAA